MAFYDNKATVVISAALLLYFLWMDIALFYHVIHRSVSQHRTAGPTAPVSTTPFSVPQLISPFTGLSIKMLMMDPVNNYIFIPAAQVFNDVTKFSSVYFFITPNMVSFIGILFAVGAAKCVCLDEQLYHWAAIFLLQMRTFCDALDGIMAKSRLGMVQHVSLSNTSGYVVDVVADVLGFVAFLIGCIQYLRTAVPKHKYYIPLSTNESCKECKESNGGPPQNNIVANSNNQKRIFYVVLCFALQLALGSFFWEYYIYAYHNLLETTVPTDVQTDAQNDVLRSSITFVLMWFWRFSNAQAFIQFLLFAIYINKLWEFLTWIQFVGFAHILTLAFFTEMHMSTVRNYILSFT